MKTITLTILLAAAAGTPLDTALAQNEPGPSIPPALRSQAPGRTPVASGDALQKQVLEKLRRRFEEADIDANGKLTEEEARRAGLGFIAGNFDQIDNAHAGAVTFRDVARFLDQRATAQRTAH